MSGEGKMQVAKRDPLVKQEMLDGTKDVTYGSFSVKDASGMEMTPEQIAIEIKRCKKTKK